MSLTTEHHDIKIFYNENKDIWECRQMELEAKTLKALRTKMDKALSVERRINNLAVITHENYGGKKIDAVATLFDTRSRSPEVWITFTRGNHTERAKRPITRVWLDTPEVREVIDRLLAQEARVREEAAKAKEIEAELNELHITPLQVASLATKQEIEE